MTGRRVLRQAASSAAMFRSASGLFRSPYRGSSSPCWMSIRSSAVLSERVPGIFGSSLRSGRVDIPTQEFKHIAFPKSRRVVDGVVPFRGRLAHGGIELQTSGLARALALGGQRLAGLGRIVVRRKDEEDGHVGVSSRLEETVPQLR